MLRKGLFFTSTLLTGIVLAGIVGSVAALATTATYNFNSDTLGQAPTNTTVSTGTFAVTDQTTLGNSLRATATAVTNGIAALSFDNFASTSNYSLTWKSAYDTPGGNRAGFILRSQPSYSALQADVHSGYLFQVNSHQSGKNPNTVILYALSSGASTALSNVSLTSVSPRWFKALVVGNKIGFYYSDDGTTYTQIGATTTDSTFSSGSVQYTAGYGQGIGTDYVDDITQVTLPPTISSVATSTSGTSATVTWTTDDAADSQIEYGTTPSYTASTTLATSLVTSHSQTITGLAESTQYHFRILSTNTYGDQVASPDYTFTTGTNSITVLSPKTYQVIQRGTGNTASIAISGTYNGSPAAIEASWNGARYSIIDASPSGNTFSGTLTSQSAGEGTLLVRFTDNTSVSTSVADVGIGDIFVIAGQSNASGRGTFNQSYTSPDGTTLKASLFGNNDTWGELLDPTDSNTDQVDSVSSDAGAAGSVWPLITTLYLADQQVPIAFIPTAKGGTSITAWQRDTNASTLYGSMYRRINAVGGSVKAVLFFQGETDADNAMARSTYLSNLENFSNAVYSDFGVKTVVGQIGNQNITASNLDAIRLAELDSWNTGTTTLPGPTAPDIDLVGKGGDGLHFTSNGNLETWANRWWAAIQKDFFGGSDGRGPKFVSAEENSDRTTVTVTFSDDTLPLILNGDAGGFIVKDDGISVGTISTTTVGTNAIRIGLASALTGTATISFGSGSSVSGVTVPTDSSTYNLPIEIFIDESVSQATPSTVTNSSSSSGAGGGWAPPPPMEPVGGFSAKASASRTVGKQTLTFNFGSDVLKIAIADNSGFVAASYVEATPTIEWPNSATGILFVKFCTTYNVCSNPIEVSTPLATNPSGASSFQFTRDLTLKDSGPDVTMLQQFLIAGGYPISAGATGYFGQQTQSALAAYQKDHNVKPSSGYFGPLTRATIATGLTSSTPPAQTATYQFTHNFQLKDANEDIRQLQMYLNAHGFTLTSSGPGSAGNETTYFGPATYTSLVQFQNAHAVDILAPLGITQGTGYFGASTRAYINSH